MLAVYVIDGFGSLPDSLSFALFNYFSLSRGLPTSSVDLETCRESENVQKIFTPSVFVALWHLIKRRSLETLQKWVIKSKHKLDSCEESENSMRNMQAEKSAAADCNLHLIPPNESLSCLSQQLMNESLCGSAALTCTWTQVEVGKAFHSDLRPELLDWQSIDVSLEW